MESAQECQCGCQPWTFLQCAIANGSTLYVKDRYESSILHINQTSKASLLYDVINISLLGSSSAVNELISPALMLRSLLEIGLHPDDSRTDISQWRSFIKRMLLMQRPDFFRYCQRWMNVIKVSTGIFEMTDD